VTNGSERSPEVSRRQLLKWMGALGCAAAAGMGAGCAGSVAQPSTSATHGSARGLEKTDVTLGFIPLTDCSPLVIASEKGIYKKYGLNVRVRKMASWGATRDAVHKGDIDGAHMLLGMVVASSLGAGDVGAPVPTVPMCVLQVLNVNGQAITLKKALLDANAKTPAAIKRFITENNAKLNFAMTFPTGTHAMWMRYWLATGGLHPDRDVKLITIPPPQMVANMKTGNMDGYCVGEPWGARAVAEGIGGTGITTQALWKDHPEKVLGVTEEFAGKHPKTCVALTAATLEACRWLDDARNRAEAAEIVGRTEYVNCQSEVIRDRLLGKYVHVPGGDAVEDSAYMRFFERDATVPYLSHATWFMSQHRRWGMLAEKPDYLKEARRIMRHDLYSEACKLAKVEVPAAMESRGKETLFDGTVFDPADPESYAGQFAIKNI